MRSKSLVKAIQAAGGPAKLAKVLQITSQAISQWQRVPAERVLDVEKAIDGAITRHQLRPDIYPHEAA